MPRIRTLVLLCALMIVPPIASAQEEPPLLDDERLIEEEFDTEEIYDPFEGFNRAVFWFNDRVDRYVLEPVARGYDDVLPRRVKVGISSFFENLQYPQYLVSDLVQLKFTQALQHTGRFLINTTIGIGGLIDVAEDIGLPEHDEDFGVALAYYDIPPGPYLILPFLGPSNVRDTFGRAVDTVLDPLFFINYADVDKDVSVPVTTGLGLLRVVDSRVGLLEAVDALRESSIDMYLATQAAYYQHRRGLLYDGVPPDDEVPLDDLDGESGLAHVPSESGHTLTQPTFPPLDEVGHQR